MYEQHRYRFNVSIDKDTLLAIYKGVIQRVRVRTFEGLIVDIDANHLKKYTTEDGIRGTFELVTSEDNRFIKLLKLK